MKKVAVLGVGPAGLMAAHAASLSGAMVHLFSQGGDDGPTKSRIGGAQFLHKAIPVVCNSEPDAQLLYLTAGTTEGYRAKVYGDADVPFVSMERLPSGPRVPAWSLANAYDKLWGIYCGGTSTNVMNLDPQTVLDVYERGGFDLVVSTIPKHNLCLAHAGLVDKVHTFVSQPIRIANHAALPVDDNTMVYDGTDNVSWYRTSLIFGTGSTEFGESAPERLPYKDIVKIKKPIRTDCSCFDGRILFTGRFGAWRKGILTHDAFIDTWKALN